MEIGAGQIGRIAGESQRWKLQLVWFDFAGSVGARTKLGDTMAVDIETDNRRAGSREGDRRRQTDIAQSGNGNFAIMAGQAHLLGTADLRLRGKNIDNFFSRAAVAISVVVPARQIIGALPEPVPAGLNRFNPFGGVP
jgi:hypothetical protein